MEEVTLTFVYSTSLQPGTTPAQGVFIEMFITCALVVAVLMLAAEKHQATAFAPVDLNFFPLGPHVFK
jgi:aquaporin related protein